MKQLLAATFILIVGLAGHSFGQAGKPQDPPSSDAPNGAKTPDDPGSRQGGGTGTHGDNF